MRLDALSCPAPACWRILVSLATVALFSIGLPAIHASASAQEPSGRFRVLVVPLQSGPLDDDFGEDIAEMIRDRLDELPTHAPVSEGDFEDALRRYDVEQEDLNAIRARQLANLIGAQVVFFGSIEEGQSGEHNVTASFIEVQSGDEVGVPAVTVTDDNDDEARKVAEAAMEAFERQVAFLRARQFCADYVGSQQPENALRNCNDALAINSTSVPALFNKGLAFRQLFENAMGEGVAGAAQAGAMDTADVEALRVQADSLLEAADGESDGDMSLTAEAEQWGDSAVAAFESVLEQQPGHREAMQNAAYVYTRLDEAERASELYSQYLELDPGNVPVRLKVAYDLAQGGLMKEAIDVIEEGIEQDSTNVDLLQFLGDYSLRYSSEDSTYLPVALASYEQVLEIKGEETDLQLLENVMAAYTRSGRVEEAIDFAQRALSAHQDSPRLWSLYADALARAERYSDATGAMDSVLAIDESYPNGHLKRGMFKLEAGNREAAMSDFQQAIDRGTSGQDDVFRVFWSQAHSAREQGNLTDALELFAMASEFAGDQSQEVQFWWAYTHFQLGEQLAEPEDAGLNQLQRAREFFQQAAAHFEQAGNVRPEVAQLKDAAGKWLQNVDARIRRAQRAGS